MSWGIVAAICIAGIIVFFIAGNRKMAKAHRRFTSADVESALNEVISPESITHDSWDLFLSWPIDDPYLESVRQRCLAIVKDDVAPSGQDISEAAEEQVRRLLDELHEKTTSTSLDTGRRPS